MNLNPDSLSLRNRKPKTENRLFTIVGVTASSACALDESGSPARVKEAGLLKVEGRDYLVADGDILRFRFQR